MASILTPGLAARQCRVEDWRADTSVIRVYYVSSPLHVKRNVRISRITLPCVFHARGYVTYRAGAALGAGLRTW
jgi:hypothetical protein